MKRLHFYLVPIVIAVAVLVSSGVKNPRLLEVLADAGSSHAAYRLGQHHNDEQDGKTYNPDIALAWFERAAEAGSMDAMHEIGLLHLSGVVDKPSFETGHRFVLKAAEAGHPDAMYTLAFLLEIGMVATRNSSEAERWYLKSLEHGVEEAQFGLYRLHLENQETFGPFKSAKAFKELRKLADKNDAYALLTIGNAHIEGYGVPKNPAKGLALIERATETMPFAHFVIAEFHFLGRGVKVDYHKALRHLFKASEHGSSSADLNIGVMYEHGLGVEKDFVKAARYYRKALEQKSLGALTALGILYRNGTGVTQDYDEANRLFQEAADIGLMGGSANVGWMQLHGWGMPVDRERGLVMIETAADEKDYFGTFYMALLLEEGEFVDQDRERALELYRVSADRGNPLARAALRRLGKQI
ncbi:MAG: SEL1-like repeat protein [Roseibium sp.]|nr:SEL1-like repeat protein [Roseibium sp.]